MRLLECCLVDRPEEEGPVSGFPAEVEEIAAADAEVVADAEGLFDVDPVVVVGVEVIEVDDVDDDDVDDDDDVGGTEVGDVFAFEGTNGIDAGFKVDLIGVAVVVRFGIGIS